MFRYLAQKLLRRQKEKQGPAIFLGIGSKFFRGRKREFALPRRVEWIEESFIDVPSSISSKTDKNYLGIALSAKKIFIFFLVIISGLGALFFRAFELQVIRGNSFLAQAEKNRTRALNIASPRGIIYDRAGRPLVENVPSFSVYITPQEFNQQANQNESIEWLKANLKDEQIEKNLSRVLNISASAKEYFEPVLLAEGIDYEQALKLRIESQNYSGVNVEVAAKRRYLNTFNNKTVESLSHVLGYLGRINPSEYEIYSSRGYLYNDLIGKTGLEAAYEKFLRGRYGKEQVEVDSIGRATKIISKEEMEKGGNVYLSLDLEMQSKLESILKNELARIGRRKAAAVALDPRSGEIYALVSLPAFDNNDFSFGIADDKFKQLIEDKDTPLFNRVISGEYPSGSIIKPLIASAALEQGIINENTSFLSSGGIQIAEWFFPDWKPGGHGIINVVSALAESVNTFFYIIGGGLGEFDGLGVYKIKEYGEQFGLGKLSRVDLPNEADGFLPTPEWKQKTKKERWYIGDTYHLSIGQGDLLVTPLQMAAAYAVFANGGQLIAPKLAKSLKAMEKVETPEKNVRNKNFLSPNTISVVRAGLRKAVTSGSAKILNSLPVASAAKTGTAQWLENKKPHAWFAAFAPMADAEIVLVVLIEESGEGSEVSAPIAEEFLNWYFREYKKHKI